jgi:hypothetical protein
VAYVAGAELALEQALHDAQRQRRIALRQSGEAHDVVEAEVRRLQEDSLSIATATVRRR